MKDSFSLQPIPGRDGIPAEDLAELQGAVKLTHLALEAAMAAGPPSTSFGIPGGPSAGVPVLTTIYAYALARGWYGAEEIAERMGSDGCLRYLSRGLTADPALLRMFRRQHGELIRWTLALLISRSVGAVSGVDPKAEANLRLRAAIGTDSLALDM